MPDTSWDQSGQPPKKSSGSTSTMSGYVYDPLTSSLQPPKKPGGAGWSGLPGQYSPPGYQMPTTQYRAQPDYLGPEFDEGFGEGPPPGPLTHLDSGGYRGGGIKPLSQEAYDAMLALLKRRPSNWTPDPYQGQNILPFDDQRYRMAEDALMQAYMNAGNQINQGWDAAYQGLQNNWDVYGGLRALAQPTLTPELRESMTFSSAPDVINEVNAESAASDQAFQRWLAANEMTQAQAHGSRLGEVDMARQFGLDQLGQQKLADKTGLSMAELAALEDWQRRDEERRYANSLLGQQWDREASKYNADLDASLYGTTLSPLLELVAQANQAGLPINIEDLLGV